MNPRSVLMLTVAAGLVLAGVVLEGTQQNPWNPVVCYLLPAASLEGLRRRKTLWADAICTVVTGLAIYGATWTLGPEHAVSSSAALVYVGLVGGVMSALMIPLRPGNGNGNESA